MSQLNMNNRQSGRRRGRNNNSNNNNRSQSGGGRGGVDQANRIDSRARGNGAQMIEKYRNLARDAQLAGDRVQTEYYLQFADHYFRVVSDFRARQEEKAAANGQERSHDRSREIRGVEDFDGHDDSGFETESDRGDSEGEGDERRGDGEGRGNRDRRDDDNRGNRQPRDRGDRNRDRDQQPRREAEEADSDSDEAGIAEEAAPAPRAGRRGPRRARPVESEGEGNGGGIDTAVLPPAIGRPEASTDESDEGEAPAPKARRTRRTLAPRGPGVEAAE
ncbi:MAG: DUF4167 domain-containing protein [Sphingopyxis sp.]|nr:DUF4167 domain-containing protein [Sphingopyxis sp.]